MKKSKCCIYERLIPFKNIHYWIFWPILSICLLVIGSVNLYIMGEKQYPWAQLIFASYFGGIPTLFIWFYYSFQKRMINLSPILWKSNEEFDEWLKENLNRIFSINSFPAYFFTFLVVIMGHTTIYLLGYPFENNINNIFAAIVFSFVLFVCGHGGYTLIALMVALHYVVKRSPRLPFFQFSHPAISDLQSIYSFMAMAIFYGYSSLVIALRNGPYGLTIILQIWVTILAFFPLFIFIFSFLQIHKLISNIKYKSVKEINNRLQFMLKKINGDNSLRDLKKLETLMKIQTKVQSISEWPLDLQGLATFIIVLTTALVQIFAIWRGNTP